MMPHHLLHELRLGASVENNAADQKLVGEEELADEVRKVLNDTLLPPPGFLSLFVFSFNMISIYQPYLCQFECGNV